MPQSHPPHPPHLPHTDENLRTLLEDLLDAPADPASEASIPLEIPGFEIGEFLGEGGSSLVFKARQSSTGQPVAIKFLRADLIHRRNAERMKRECAALVRLDDRAFPRIIDSGELKGIGFIVQEFVDGRPLTTFVEEEKCDLKARLQLLIRIARCVGLAHEQGIVHRDLKPGNILIRPDGSPVIVDFGLSSGDGAGFTEELTVEGAVMGTPAYMAPEQAQGAQSSKPSSDVFALGVILFEALTGGLPKFNEDYSTTTMLFSPGVPGSKRKLSKIGQNHPLRRIVAKALEADSDSRYPNATALADDLQAWLEGNPVNAPRLPFIRSWRSALIISAMVIFGLSAWFLIAIFNAPENPPARRGAAMAFDPFSQRVVMFGGFSRAQSPEHLGDFWALEDEEWIQIDVRTPSARAGTAMATDAINKRIMLVGGSDESYYRRDSWAWDGLRWVVVLGREAPFRGQHAMVFDDTADQLLLFGGAFQQDGQGNSEKFFFNDLYALHNDGWKPVDTPGPRPAKRAKHAMAFDSERRCLVLFGGHRVIHSKHPKTSVYFWDTWEFAGGQWNERIPDHLIDGESSQPAYPIGMIYHESLKSCVLVDVDAHTWKWDGSAWLEIKTETSPTPRGYAAMAYDPVNDRIVLFGGQRDSVQLDDTWVFENGDWRLLPTK